MSGSTISTTITQTVTLGSGAYASPLTLTGSGAITPTLAAYGVFTTLTSAYLDNQGVVLGGSAATFSNNSAGGARGGVLFQNGAGTLLNVGTIKGGAGGSGGFGAYASGGTVINQGVISGGYGRYFAVYGVSIGDGSLNNAGIIAGGSGPGQPGGGVAASIGGRITNSGTILSGGGSGAMAGGFLFATEAVEINSSTLTNTGTIIGGNDLLGGFGVHATGQSRVANSGLIAAGAGSVGGTGVYLYGQSTLNNTGIITGGSLTPGGTAGGYGVWLHNNDLAINRSTASGQGVISGRDGARVDSGGGTLLNYGTIAGSFVGIYIAQTTNVAATITNEAGGVISAGSYGVYLKASPSITNTGIFTNAGLISGQEQGFTGYGSIGTIVNTGTIMGVGAGTPTFAVGIFVQGSAEVINGASNATNALISGVGASFGIDITKPLNGSFGSVGTVINYGTIRGGSLSGVELKAGTVINGTVLDNQALITGVNIAGTGALVENFGTLNSSGQTGPALVLGSLGVIVNGAGNDSSALIESSGVNGVNLGKLSTLTNYGTITGGTINGLYAQSGVISNASTGVIIGGRWGAHVAGYGAQTVINAGLIEGTIGVAALAPYTYNDVFANSGTIGSLLGSVGTAIAFAKGNDLLIDDPTGVFIGTVSGGSGANTIELATGGPGIISGIGTQFTQFNNINFDAGATWSAEGNLAGLAGGQSISGFALPDTIILDGFTETGYSYVSGIGLELSSAGTVTATIGITGSFSTPSFTVENISAGTEILLCYLRGTKIATPAGDIAIEDLNIGDPVITRFNGYRKIKWIGRQSFSGRFVARNPKQIPVRIAPGALGQNLPWRELYVSPGHSMLLGGILVLAETLINGVTITQDWDEADIHYYQLEFETHDCVLAEGAWSESFADGPDMRAMFHNQTEFYEVFPDYIAPAQFSMCAERPTSGPALQAALLPIMAQAAKAVRPGPLRGWVDHADGANIEGWAIDLANPHLAVWLDIWCGEECIGAALACNHRADLEAAGIAAGWCQFSFALPVDLPLASRRDLRVCRASDGAMLPMTDICQAELGGRVTRCDADIAPVRRRGRV